MFLNYFIVVMLAIGNIILIATLMIYIHDLLDYIFAFYDFISLLAPRCLDAIC